MRFLLVFLASLGMLAQTVPSPSEKLPVSERMAKARAAKADKKVIRAINQDTAGVRAAPHGQDGRFSNQQQNTSGSYRAPVVKLLKGPNGEVVHTGERGGYYYVNKNGNKTYLSSNQ